MAPRRLLAWAALALLLAAQLAAAVDRSKFKNCDQASFCKRNRNRSSGVQAYKVVPESVRVDQEAVTVHFQLTDSNWPMRKPLAARLSVLRNEVVRLWIGESEPKHKRYEVQDVVLPDALAHGAAGILHKKEEGVVSLTMGDKNEYEVAFAVAPAAFAVTVRAHGKPVVVFNGRSKLHFEQYRDKNPRPGDGAQADPGTSAFPYDEDGMWDERFGTHADSKPRGPADVAADVDFVGFSHVYGIPEHASSLALKTTTGSGSQYSDPYRLYNLDVFEYELDNPMSLYGAIPFMMAHSATHTVGMLWLNAAETFIDVSDGTAADGAPVKQTHWMSESGVIDVYLFLGPRPANVLQQYATLTGFPALPQQFAIAYHQCRWNYKSEEDVGEVDAGFDKHDIPYDVIWLDIEHTDGKKYFTWDKTLFPTPRNMQNRIAAKGRKMVTIVDPHIKRQAGYHVHTEAQNRGLYVKNSDSKGGDYEGWCWPGSVSYLDFTRPEVRDYWADLFALSSYDESSPNLYIWNDMNEPSVFNGPEVTMYKDNLHGVDDKVEHRDVHNLYGMYVHRATSEGLIKRDNARPFVLTRSFFAGSQRYGAMWTGDNMAKWDHLRASMPMLMSLAVSGFQFVGADAGGFFGNPDTELLVRWYQAAAFQPFFRAHAHIDTARREPWLFGDATTDMIRDAIRARYALLPYIYTVFHEASTTAAPVMRPLWFQFPDDPKTFAMEDQFLLGSDILVRPVTAAGQTTSEVYLPGSEPWYDVRSFVALGGERPASVVVKSPLDKIPVFQRGGSIVPRRERARRSSALMVRDPYTLVVALDRSGKATGTLYADDGRSFDFRGGKFLHRTFRFEGDALVSKRSPGALGNGTFATGCVIERVVILGALRSYTRAQVSDAAGAVREASVVALRGRVEVRKPDLSVDADWTLSLA